MNEYDGHWISTYTGKKFHYLDPQPSEIDIRDIAHALALTCRFGGHCRVFYSVAEHSVRVTTEVDSEYKLSALLHDAHEAYLHDVPRPIKGDIVGYKKIADNIQRAVNDKFRVATDRSIIKFADNVLLATEARDLLSTTEDWAGLPEPLAEIIYPWTWQDAKASFLTYFRVYGGEE